MSIPLHLSDIPNTIFDSDDHCVLDISEEMEEIRELLYELVKNNFASGVIAEHLAKIYKESYETTGLGPVLPDNWLDHVQVADEFEVVCRGPITMIYTRQRNTPPIKEAQPMRNILVISGAVVQSPNGKRTPRIRLTDKELAQQMKTIFAVEPIAFRSVIDVVIVSCESLAEIFVQLNSKVKNFEQLCSTMDNYYGIESNGEIVTEPEIDGVYAVKNDNHFYRAIYKASNKFFLVDLGQYISAEGKTIKRLRAEYALPRLYPIYAFAVTLDPSNNLKVLQDAQKNKYSIPLRFISVGDDGIYFVRYDDVKSPMPGIDNRGDNEEIILTSMNLSELPKNRFAVHVLAVFNPINISVRQCIHDPIPDYIASEVEKDSLAQTSILPFADLKVGCFYAAKVESDLKWERVQLLGPSAVDADCFRVYCVDIGSFGVVRKHNIRRLKLPLGLRKILLLKCKIFGITPKDDSNVWDREIQLFLCTIFNQVKTVEIEPIEEWSYFNEVDTLEIPCVSARWFIDGKNVADYLIDQRLAKPSQ